MEENIQQDDPRHWRYRKNKSSGVLDRMKEAEEEEKKVNVIEFTDPSPKNEGEPGKRLHVDATKEALEKLNRDEQVAVCKELKIRGYSKFDEKEIVKIILNKFLTTKKKRSGVTTIDSLQKAKKKE